MYILLFLILFCAALCDLKYLKIPNSLILLGICCSISILLVSLDFTTLVSRLLVSLIIFISLFSFFQIGILGAGDIKLLMMMSLFLSISELLQIVFISFNLTLLQLSTLSIFYHLKSKYKETIPLAISIFWGYGFWIIVCNLVKGGELIDTLCLLIRF